MMTNDSIIDLAAISNCMACKLFDNCVNAFRGKPGQYCHDWAKSDILFPCCCDTNDQCMPSTTSCLCHELYDSEEVDQNIIFVGGVIIVLSAIVMICACTIYRRHTRYTCVNGRISERRPLRGYPPSNTYVYTSNSGFGYPSDSWNTHSGDSGNTHSGDSGNTYSGDSGDSGITCSGDS